MTHKLITTLRIAAVALLLTVAFGATAQVERGQKSFGPKVGYITKSSSVLAGLTFDYAFSRHGRFGGVTSHQNSFGLNAGAGWEIRLSGALRLGFEAKYTLIRHNPNGQFAARIAYVF